MVCSFTAVRYLNDYKSVNYITGMVILDVYKSGVFSGKASDKNTTKNSPALATLSEIFNFSHQIPVPSPHSTHPSQPSPEICPCIPIQTSS